MRRSAGALVGLFVLGLLGCATPAPNGAPATEDAPPGLPQWIWSSDEPGVDEEVWFRRSFELDAAEVERLTLMAGCDNELDLYLDGTLVATATEWWQPVRRDVTDALARDEETHRVEVWCRNGDGPAGLWVQLVVEGRDGQTRLVLSDTRWEVAETRAGPGRAATALGPLGCEPWGTPTDFGDGTPSSATAAAELEAPPGFRVDLVHAVNRRREGSWVSLAADDRGRLYASDQYGGLYRITPGAPEAGRAASATVVERVDVALGEAHGLLWAHDALYVVVCDGGRFESGLYRVCDTDADDLLDHVEQLQVFDGNGEHGPHAVVLDPDGTNLWVVAGNHTRLPDEVRHSRVPRVWGEDQLLPRRDDPGGHAVGRMAPGGWIVRTDPDGEHWELVACGLRNAYDIAFDASGELFTFDADMEWDVGLPWYRPTRILHVVSGAEYGWRHGSGKWPEGVPDAVPGVTALGLGSPTGIAFGTGAGFPAPWDRALFAADWAYGTIHAVHLEQQGATYDGRSEPFVSGAPLPVTDLAVASDGALYFTTGGRRTQSGLYRVQWVGDEEDGGSGSGSGSGSGGRASRRELEALHGPAGAEALAVIWPALGHPDRAVRYAARVALEHQPVERWADRALAESPPQVLALLALVRCAPETHGDRILEALAELDGDLADAQLRGDLLRVFELACIRDGAPVGELRAAWLARLEPLYPTGDAVTDRALGKLLVFLGSEVIVSRLMAQALETADATQEQQVSWAELLGRARAGWTDAQRAAYLDWMDERLPAWDGGASLRLYARAMRDDFEDDIPEASRAAVLAARRAPAAYTDTPAVAERSAGDAPAVYRDWTVAELAGALPELDAPRDFESGRRAYASTRCAECHRIQGDGGGGGNQGPDLSGVGKRFSAYDLLVSLVDPSQAISDQYEDTKVFLRNGDVVTGRVESRRATSLIVRTAPPDERRVEIPLVDITLERPSEVSRMPSGLLAGLDREQVLDLIAYLRAGGLEPGATVDVSSVD